MAGLIRQAMDIKIQQLKALGPLIEATAYKQLKAGLSRLKLIAPVLQIFELTENFAGNWVFFIELNAKGCHLRQDITEPCLIRNNNAAAVTHLLRLDMLVGEGVFLHRRHMHSALMGKGRQTDKGRMFGGCQVNHLTDCPRRIGQALQLRLTQAVIAQLELKVRDDTTQIGVTTALAITIHRSLHHARPRLHRCEGISHSSIGIVVGVNPNGYLVQVMRFRHHCRRNAGHIVGQCAAVCIA